MFVLFKSKDHLLSFARYMNTRLKNLKFIFDSEQNNSFFCDYYFVITIFRKDMFNGFFTNFDSFIFVSYKTGLIFTLLFHCFTICLDMQSFH